MKCGLCKYKVPYDVDFCAYCKADFVYKYSIWDGLKALFLSVLLTTCVVAIFPGLIAELCSSYEFSTPNFIIEKIQSREYLMKNKEVLNIFSTIEMVVIGFMAIVSAAFGGAHIFAVKDDKTEECELNIFMRILGGKGFYEWW